MYSLEYIRLDMDNLQLEDLSKRASSSSEAAEWERECYLKAICNWTPFAELAKSEVALGSVAEHPGISVRHFGRFRDELLRAGEEHHRFQVCCTFILQISPPTVTPSGPGKSVTIARVSLWPHMILQEEGG